jgi:hypothetical protein
MTSEPLWTVSAQEAGIETALGDCAYAGQLKMYQAQPVEGDQETSISADEARKIADRVIEKHHFSIQGLYAESPRLIRMTLPDGQERLTWYRVLVTDDGGATLIGKADVVYVDAQTGDALLRITDVPISDPVFACGVSPQWPIVRLIRRAGLLLFSLYFALLVPIGGIWLWRRHIRQTRVNRST